MIDSRDFLRRLFDAALAAARPALCVPPHLPDPATVKGRIVVVGAGKAAAAMAAAVEAAWAAQLVRVSGLVVTRYGHGAATRKIEVIEAAHPVPAPGEPAFARCETRVIATAQDALHAAAAAAQAAGVTPLILGDRIEGEAREAARVMAGIALSCRAHGLPAKPPCVLLSGGETTVTVKGHGRGGRNAEFLLALALALNGAPSIHALACDTDGIDGSEDNAGAQIDPATLARGMNAGMDAKGRLMDNDAYGFFAALDDLIVTGPTRTNVNDFRAILIED